MLDTLDRREFIGGVTALASFTAMMGYAQAEPIKTDTSNLNFGTVNVTGADGAVFAVYVAHNGRPGPVPVVVVIHDIFRIWPYTQDICHRLAKLGYLALCPDLFSRKGDTSTLKDQAALMAVVRTVDDATVKTDLDATFAWAVANGGDKDRLGVSGWCWGGRHAWLYAEQTPSLKAAAAWYGLLNFAQLPFQPHDPADLTADLKVPTLGLYGGKDGSNPPEILEAMRTALGKTRVDTEIIVYPEAGHAFHNDYRASYREDDAKDAWNKMLKWFTNHGLTNT